MFNRQELNNNKVRHYLIMKKAQLGRFYLLPKIHKRTSNVPERTVISKNETATENISAFLDFHLQNIVSATPHILQDTRDVLQRVNQIGDIPENALLVSFDVVGLYPHIPHDQVVEIMRRFLDKREDESVSSESLCKLANIVLKHNNFELGKDVYHQILGTAMGSKSDDLEEEIFEKSLFQPYLWLRYLDDIFCIWTKGLENLKEFFGFLNNVHPSIKFTMEYSQKQINFSDVLISKNDNESSLVTSLFTKSTDSHQYLHATSCHRSVYKKTIPYGQAIRMKRICSNEVDLQRKLLDLESLLTDRRYKSEIIRQEIQKVNLIGRNNLLKKRPKHQGDSITLVLTFHLALNVVFDVLKRAHRHVQKSPVLKVVLPKPPRIVFRNPKTLRDKLVRSKLKLTDDAERGNFPCGRGN